jgi:acetyltransferase-like isoleucine patch superfamily enzyme
MVRSHDYLWGKLLYHEYFFQSNKWNYQGGLKYFFGHNCMVLTGTHNFFNGKRGSLNLPQIKETPLDGRDILIGEGCFIGSGAILIGPLIIGDNVIIAAGSVVNKNIPNACFVAGVPAEVKKKF